MNISDNHHSIKQLIASNWEGVFNWLNTKLTNSDYTLIVIKKSLYLKRLGAHAIYIIIFYHCGMKSILQPERDYPTTIVQHFFLK